MSKNPCSLTTVFWIVAVGLASMLSARAGEADISIEIRISDGATAIVTGSFPDGRAPHARNLAFLDEYAGAVDLASRVRDVEIIDRAGSPIKYRRFAPGDFVAEEDIARFSYVLSLRPPGMPGSAAHVSCLSGQSGMIMLHDLLPRMEGLTAKVKIDIPKGWTIQTAEKQLSPNGYSVSRVEDAVFYLGADTRTLSRPVGRSVLTTAISGNWLFSDVEAAEMAAGIFREYGRQLGPLRDGNYYVRISPFPFPSRAGNWEADTRGSNITILSADMPFATQSIQVLHEQLRHEVFHWWIPNGLSLTGRYDWFYEGFALYQSLKLGLEVNRIRFHDYLDTLSRAYNIDESQVPRRSLIDAAKARWSGANSQLYARGMLVAFLCDLALLERSGGSRSVTHLLRDLYAVRRRASETDGNAAIVAILREHDELRPIVERYILGSEPIDWANLTAAVGLESSRLNQVIQLRVFAKPSGRQAKLLDKLGYNNWRKGATRKK